MIKINDTICLREILKASPHCTQPNYIKSRNYLHLLGENALPAVQFAQHWIRVEIDLNSADLHSVVDCRYRTSDQRNSLVSWRMPMEVPLEIRPILLTLNLFSCASILMLVVT